MARHPPLPSTTLRGTLSTAVLALSAGALSVSPAAAATGTITRLSDKRLDVTGNSTADGAKVQFWACGVADSCSGVTG
ncbi:hypothetical protein ABZV67_09030 [Streptomyces sp. NPDC005065]|uniref:hypothetical protein n=1 Tax=Streptomyces sp. NPDC005065 TaxID=3154461 RepID=UPI0033A194DD